MNIFFTLDYEIYSGKNPGTPQKCMVEPSEELVKIGNKYGAKFVFFVDIGYILKLDEYRKKYAAADQDYKIVVDQIERLLKEGHDMQLHIHPHWEDCRYGTGGWQMETRRFSLLNFNERDIEEIVTRYSHGLRSLVGDNVFAYRAGGWCLQPFEKLYQPLKENGIWLDSTVYQEGYHHSKTHFFDFRGAPSKTEWHFETDPIIEMENGYFTEVPIASYRVSPLFYWKYAVSKKISRGIHKPFGDGQALPAAKSDLIHMLTRFSHSVVSIDGYKSSFLQKALNKYVKDYGDGNFVTIGHPKGITPYSLRKLDLFMAENRRKHHFTTLAKTHSN